LLRPGARRIPSRRATCRYSCSRLPSRAGLVVAPGWPLAASGGQRLAITGISGFATPAESEVAPSTEARSVPSTPRKHCVRPRLSTRPTPPGGSGTGACDGRSVSLARPASACGSRCLRNPHCARRAGFAAVSPGCLRCFQRPEAPRCRSGTRPAVAVAEAWR
jgi:hypothetical protein